MGSWRTKLIFLLIVYFAGFATAVYCLAPAPGNQDEMTCAKSFPHSALKSDEFASSFNTGMHKCLAVAKDAAVHVSEFIKQRLDETNKIDG